MMTWTTRYAGSKEYLKLLKTKQPERLAIFGDKVGYLTMRMVDVVVVWRKMRATSPSPVGVRACSMSHSI